MIDFKDTKIGVRVAMREGIETRSQKNVLSNSLCHRIIEHVFCIAAPCHDKCAQSNRERSIRTDRCTPQLLAVSISQDRGGDRIVEDEGLRIIELMRCATQRHAKSGAGWSDGLH